MKGFGILRLNFIEVIFLSTLLIFSFWLMFHTFSYREGALVIAVKAWSDFANHIPLIRSFSLGDNFPPEFPLFPGEPIRYHFLFYVFVGFLERIGLRIDLALNIPSALSFAALIIMIYFLGKTLFQNKVVGALSVIFFLFNGSFSFLEFFKNHPLSMSTINDIVTNTTFPSFGPYDGRLVSAFWNLNIYTNQRHLALPLALLFLIIFFVIRFEAAQKRLPLTLTLLFGIAIGIMPLSHSSLFVMAITIVAILLFLLPRQRLSLLLLLILTGMLSLPRIHFLGSTATFIPHIQLGYLVGDNLILETFVTYWIANLGLFFFLIPLGFFFASPLAKKILIAFFSLFIIGNMIQFSPEIAANHKFFNAFLIIGNMFVAYSLVRVWQSNLLGRAIIPFLLFFMVFSGIIDFFPIKNDKFIELADYAKNPDVKWIVENTPKDAVFLNSSYLYHPASLAGRKIFLGWPYFPWSLGYDTNGRDMIRKKLFNSSELESFCNLTKQYKMRYVSIDRGNDGGLVVNHIFFESNFPRVYRNAAGGLSIYDTGAKCED